MASLFGQPHVPNPPDKPAVDTSLQDAKVAAAQRRNKAKGYQSTILSTLAQPDSGTVAGPGTKQTFGS